MRYWSWQGQFHAKSLIESLDWGGMMRNKVWYDMSHSSRLLAENEQNFGDSL